eukprot:g131.t1
MGPEGGGDGEPGAEPGAAEPGAAGAADSEAKAAAADDGEAKAAADDSEAKAAAADDIEAKAAAADDIEAKAAAADDSEAKAAAADDSEAKAAAADSEAKAAAADSEMKAAAADGSEAKAAAADDSEAKAAAADASEAKAAAADASEAKQRADGEAKHNAAENKDGGVGIQGSEEKGQEKAEERADAKELQQEGGTEAKPLSPAEKEAAKEAAKLAVPRAMAAAASVQSKTLAATRVVAEAKYTAIVTSMYQKHEPDKLEERNFVKEKLNKYSGREEELVDKLRAKFGMEAVDKAIEAAESEEAVSLDLSGEYLGAPGCKTARLKLFSFLKGSPCTRNLRLPQNGLGKSECTLLGEVLKFSSTITMLDLSGNPLAGEPSDSKGLDFAGVDALFESVGKSSTLTRLDLASVNLGGWNGKYGDERTVDLAGAECVARLQGNSTLRRLNLGSNQLSAAGVAAVANALDSTKIQDLNLSNNEMLGFWGNDSSGLLATASLFRKERKLVALNLTGNSLHLLKRTAGEALAAALAARLGPVPKPEEQPNESKDAEGDEDTQRYDDSDDDDDEVDEDLELGLFDHEVIEVGLLCSKIRSVALKQLDLSGERVGSSGCLVIATLLKSTPMLEKLVLDRCGLCSFFVDDMGCHTHGQYSTHGVEALVDAIFGSPDANGDGGGSGDGGGGDGDAEGEGDGDGEGSAVVSGGGSSSGASSSLRELSLAGNCLFGLDSHGDAGEYNSVVLDYLVDALLRVGARAGAGGPASSAGDGDGEEERSAEAEEEQGDGEGAGAGATLTSLNLSRNFASASGLPSLTRLLRGAGGGGLKELDLSYTGIHEHDSHHDHHQQQDSLWMGKFLRALKGNTNVLRCLRFLGVRLEMMKVHVHSADADADADAEDADADVDNDGEIDFRERLLSICEKKKMTLYLCAEPHSFGGEPEEEDEEDDEEDGQRGRGKSKKKGTRAAGGRQATKATSSKNKKKPKRQFGDPKPRDVDLAVFENHVSDSSDSDG